MNYWAVTISGRYIGPGLKDQITSWASMLWDNSENYEKYVVANDAQFALIRKTHPNDKFIPIVIDLRKPKQQQSFHSHKPIPQEIVDDINEPEEPEPEPIEIKNKFKGLGDRMLRNADAVGFSSKEKKISFAR